jgi:hypothetical protein
VDRETSGLDAESRAEQGQYRIAERRCERRTVLSFRGQRRHLKCLAFWCSIRTAWRAGGEVSSRTEAGDTAAERSKHAPFSSSNSRSGVSGRRRHGQVRGSEAAISRRAPRKRSRRARRLTSGVDEGHRVNSGERTAVVADGLVDDGRRLALALADHCAEARAVMGSESRRRKERESDLASRSVGLSSPLHSGSDLRAVHKSTTATLRTASSTEPHTSFLPSPPLLPLQTNMFATRSEYGPCRPCQSEDAR